MAMNAAGEPVIAFGTNGHLYVTKWDAAADGSRNPPKSTPTKTCSCPMRKVHGWRAKAIMWC